MHEQIPELQKEIPLDRLEHLVQPAFYKHQLQHLRIRPFVSLDNRLAEVLDRDVTLEVGVYLLPVRMLFQFVARLQDIQVLPTNQNLLRLLAENRRHHFLSDHELLFPVVPFLACSFLLDHDHELSELVLNYALIQPLRHHLHVYLHDASKQEVIHGSDLLVRVLIEQLGEHTDQLAASLALGLAYQGPQGLHHDHDPLASIPQTLQGKPLLSDQFIELCHHRLVLLNHLP